jgi:hypothetical protein
MSDLSEALTSLRRICIHDSRDWSADRHDAFIYGVCVGWEPVDDVAGRHDWDDGFVARLDRLRGAVTEAIESGEAP